MQHFETARAPSEHRSGTDATHGLGRTDQCGGMRGECVGVGVGVGCGSAPVGGGWGWGIWGGDQPELLGRSVE